MSSYTLNIQVEGGNLSADCSLLTADSVEYVVAAFTFDESWTELYKTAVFRVGELVYHTPLENNACKIPFEALKEPIMYISVFGVLDTTRATTTELPIQVQNSGYTVCTPSAPTPDPYNYFIERVSELRDEAAVSADQSSQDAQTVQNTKDLILNLQKMTSEDARRASESAAAATSALVQSVDVLDEVEGFALDVNSLYNRTKDSAAYAAQSAENASTAVMNGLENHNKTTNHLAHPNLAAMANEAKNIALGKANSLCFDTQQQLFDWVAGVFERPDGKTTASLKTGDNLYVVELGVPDYWWDGEGLQPLGVEKPDLSDYYTKTELDARLNNASFELISRNEYNAKYFDGSLDAGKIYFVFEEE